MLARRAEQTPCFGVVLARSGSEVGEQPEIHDVGTSAINVEHVTLPDGRSNLVVKGARRFKVLQSDWDETYMVGTVKWLDTQDSPEAEPWMRDAVRRIHGHLARYLAEYNQALAREATLREFDEDPVTFAYAVASTLPMPLETRQRLLEATPPNPLLSLLEDTVRHETELLTKTGAYAFLPGHPGERFTSN
jgi:hypothetical protein